MDWCSRQKRSGRPSLISDDLLQETEWEIRANRRVTMRDLHHIIPEVSNTTIHVAVTEKLGYRKSCTHWVPKMLTDDHKTKRMGSTLKFFTCYAQEGDEFLDSIVTGNETWVFHHTSESKQQSLQWHHTHHVVQSAGGRLLWLGGYRSWFQDLINIWTMPATTLKNEVMYWQFIHSVAFVN